jgi:prepilin-type N-terminal cleavage/methylation domain-containing protein/prepilin-type processing-associated H-X9-DG protein
MAANPRERDMKPGFTLVELLVVVTIIVILLALLAPALSKAVYQGQLTACGAGNLKTMGLAVTSYAFDHKRSYPDRKIPPGDVALPINPYTLRRVSIGYEIRPELQKLFPLNKTVLCPLSPQVDVEVGLNDPNDPNQAEGYGSSYAMYFGWQFKDKNDPTKIWPGMFRLGDRFEYDDLLADTNTTVRFNILAGDIDLCWGAEGGPQASHPDRDNVLFPLMVTNQFFIDGRITIGIWSGPPGVLNRGLLDTNFAFADGSVVRYNDVTRVDLQPPNHPRRDSRMARVPINFNNHNNRPPGGGRDKIHLPRQ